MADSFAKEERSRIMSKIRSKNTGPERILKAVFKELMIRHQTDYKKLPCKPDFVFPSKKRAVFVHGCFWHGHTNCSRSKLPETNTDFWKAKIEKNKERDKNNLDMLRRLGWSSITIWQCELKELNLIKTQLTDFLNQPVMSARDRIRKFFEENVGQIVTTNQLSEVAGIRDYQRRIRELRNEYGLKIKSHIDRVDLKPGEYMLESLELDPAMGREISVKLRNEILERNGYTCRQCGASAHDLDDLDSTKMVRLYIDHIIPVSQGGSNNPDNLRVLCGNCNLGRSNVQEISETALNILARLRKMKRSERFEVFVALKKEFANQL